MRPNATYGAIGNKLKKKGDVHDWNDLETLIESAAKTSNASTLTPLQIIYRFLNGYKKNQNLPKLAYRKIIRGSHKMFYKKFSDSFSTEVDFFNHKILIESVDRFFQVPNLPLKE